MKIEKIDQNQLLITLSPTEMLQINLELDEKEPQNLLEQLFCALEKEHNFSMLNEKILLEMIPSAQDGYHIFITKAEKSTIEKSESGYLSVICFSEWKAVEYAWELLCGNFMKKSALYRLDGSYYFVLVTDKVQRKKVFTLLSDLGEWIQKPELFEGVLQEYGVWLTYLENFPEFLQKTVK